MYEVSEKCCRQFEQMLSLVQVQKALSYIENDQQHCLDELIELVQIEAPTGHEEQRAAVFADKLRAQGLKDVHIDEFGNVIALRRGTGKGPRVLIEGHMDTVFPFGTVKGVEYRDGFLYAPGIGDDTRALAMLLSLVRALNDGGVETAGDVLFVGTTREEGAGGLGGMKDLLGSRPDIDISLSLDNNDMSGLVYQATIGETWEVVFKGIGGHAFGAFGEVANALHAAGRAVAKIADLQVPDDPKTTFCVSNFHAGNVSAVHAYAPEASIMFNFRSNGRETFEELKKQIFNAIDEAVREETERWGKDTITYEKKLLTEIPGGAQDEHSPLVETAYLGLYSLGIEPQFFKGGGTNANIAIAKGMPALCMGRAYAPDEVSRNIHNHSVEEKFPVNCAYKAVQQALMVLLMATGISGEFDSIVI